MMNIFKKFVFLYCLSLPLYSNNNSNAIFEIDKIVARVNGVNILFSQLEQPRVTKEGGKFSLDEAIFDELVYQRAVEMNQLPSISDIDRHLVAFKIQNNLTELSDIAFEEELKGHGFTLKTYKQQLGRMIAVENVRRSEMSEKIVVTTQEVSAFYATHPKYTKEEFLLKISTLLENEINENSFSNEKEQRVWEDLGWIVKNDLSQELSIVKTMNIGEVSAPIKIGDSYQILMLVDKKDRRLKTLDEQYVSIERYLIKEKKDSFVKKFEAELKAKALIIYL